jgi:hypothetical protein
MFAARAVAARSDSDNAVVLVGDAIAALSIHF